MKSYKENIQIVCANVDEAFLYWAEVLSKMNCSQTSRDGEIAGEVLNAITVIKDPTRCIMQNKVRDMSIRYAIGEMLWYAAGTNKLKEIQKYTSQWDRMSDDGETVNSNYGFCMMNKFGFNQIDYVINLLKGHKESRQAVIHIKEPSDYSSKDVNCTVCLQFLIRNNKLYLTTYMRSNDLWLGFPFDVFQFTALQVYVSMMLGVELGSYTHIAGSLHLYERDLKKMNKNIEKSMGKENKNV